jgi:hypothetical protein
VAPDLFKRVRATRLPDHVLAGPGLRGGGVPRRAGADFADGRRRGVEGSPHFFTSDGSFFCPSLEIEHDDEGYSVTFDATGFQRFVATVFD